VYAVQTAGSGGSELLIFVPRAVHSPDLCHATSTNPLATESVPAECLRLTHRICQGFGWPACWQHDSEER
jgi:hypothetical protein